MRRLFAILASILGLIFAAPAASAPILWGAWVDGDAYGPTYDDPPWDMAAQDVFEQHTGKRASIIHYGQSWQEGGVPQPFYPGPANAVHARGAVPLLDWNPWDLWAGGSANQPKFRLSRINSGAFDSYIRSWATGVKTWGKQIIVRPMHEMNGNWYPWSEQVNGNRSGEYVRAWRRIVNIADGVGARNIEWAWVPNAVYSGSIPLSRLYPGSSYVDWVGMDGYNFGGAGWIDAGDLLYPTYQALRSLAPSKRIMIAEIGSTENGGNKAAWIAHFLSDVASQQYYYGLAAIVWFNWDADSDWSIESSPAAQAAFRNGIASPVYLEP